MRNFLLCLLGCVCFVSSAQAEVLGPGWHSVTAERLGPQEAAAYYQNKQAELSIQALKEAGLPISAMSSATEATPEITELARALQYDPKQIYDYVHNHIDYLPYFGSLKGATLTYLDGSGNDFDQASLMLALLRASGYTAGYEYGTMTIPGPRIINWIGVGPSWELVWRVFAYGGIPIEIPNANEAKVARVWIKASIGGKDYRFDPALKDYADTPRIDLSQALGYNRDELINAVSNGATVGTDYVQNLNEAALSNKLVKYSGNLASTLRSQYPNATVEEIVGGRNVVETTLSEYPAALPYPATLEAAWDEIPLEYTATMRIEHIGIDRTFFVPEIAGRRLSVTYAGSNNHPELRLEGELIAAGTATTSGLRYDLTLTIDHPYAASGGTYCDQTSTSGMKSGSTYALTSAFAGITDTLLNKRRKVLDSYTATGLPDTSEKVMGETLNIMGLTWLKEVESTTRLIADSSDFVVTEHHCLGWMAQESTYYIDIKAWINSWMPEFNVDASSEAARMASHAVSSALEHGVLEQTMGSDNPCVSTVKLLQIANANGDKVFCADKTNFASIRAQLQNYSSSRLDQFQSELASGPLEYVILPQDYAIAVNQWIGGGWLLAYYYETTAWRSTAWIIQGGLYGGHGTKKKTVLKSILEKIFPGNPPPDLRGETERNLSAEPVNMLSGAFIHERTDLTLGGEAPLGLAFSRAYTTTLNQQQRSLGYGWTHNYDIYLKPISQSDPGLGLRQPVDAASLLTALYIARDLYSTPDDLLKMMAITLTAKWAVDRLIDNAVDVHLGSQIMEYIKLADGSYAPPPGVTTVLLKNADGTFSLKERFDTRMNFDASGRIAELADVDGNKMSFTYTGGDLTRVEDAFGRRLNFSYTDGRLASVSDSAARTVSYNYDASGNLAGFTDVEGKAYGFSYDSAHRLTSITNPLSITTVTNTYDSLGRVKSQTAPRQGGGTATYDFYFPGFKNIEVDPQGNQIVYFYDGRGNPIGEENALGQRQMKKYDGQNHVVERTDPRGNKTIYVYDGNHNLTKSTNALTETTSFTYDAGFRLTDIIDPLGNNTHMDYDFEHHLIKLTDAEGNQVGFTHYTNGLLESSTDGRGTTTNFTYDAYGLPETSQVGAHPEVTYDYDAIGRMASLSDQVNSFTSFAYDKRSLLTGKTDPLGKSTTFAYDDAARLITVTDRNGETITYTYTPTGNIAGITLPDASTSTFSYDVRDNCLQMQDALGSTTYTYDAANRLTSTTDPHGFVVSYGYDAAGNLTTLTYPGGRVVSYSYDGLNRLKTVTNWLGQTTTYSYDTAGRLTKLVNFNATETTYAYDTANRLTSLENRKGDGSIISTYAYTLDRNGNRTQILQDEPLAPTLTAETIDYTYNTERNRLLGAGSLAFAWDNEGQLSSLDGANFSFDALHRLVGVTGTPTLQYAYDGRDNRLEAVRDGATTRYIYDTAGNLLAEANASNTITRYYIHGLGLLALVTPSNVTYCYHYNAIGSTVALSDVTQTLVNKYAYTPFGEVSEQTVTVAQPFKFVGRFGVLAEPNGLYYMRARYYDPETGRFITEDPIGLAGGDVNLYGYVRNNPLLLIDPWGLGGEKPWWEPDPGFLARFWEEFHRSRLPGAKWWSVAPPIGPLAVGATYYGARGLESLALRGATGRFTSFSGTRSFVYMSGYSPGFFVAAKAVRYANIALLIPTAFYTGADIGTAMHSAIEAWRE